jgi:hypothetical protein
MALSFETSGFKFAPALVPVDQNALQGLKPLSFTGGGQSPVQFKPLAGWSVPSGHPELIGQGVASGIGAIAQGITAAYQSKEAKEEKQKDREAALAIAQQKMAHETKLQGMRGENALSLLKERIKNTTPKGGIAPDYGDDEPITPPDYGMPSGDKQVPASLKELKVPPIEGGGSFKQIYLPEDQESTPSGGLIQGSSPLTNLTSPAPKEAAPSPLGEEGLRALTSIDWSQVRGSLGAGTGAGASPVDVPSSSPDWLRKPKSVTGSLSTLGGFSDEALPNTDKALADAEEAYGMRGVQPVSGGVPRAGFSSYAEAQRYIDSQADNPNWYAEGAPKPDKFGNFVIPWKHHDPAAMAAREESKKTREEATKTRQDIAKQNTLNRESAMFQSHPAIKAFAGPNGMQQSIGRFVRDYDAIIKNPESAGISDVGLLDMFARAEGGGRVTEGQARLALGSMGLLDKAKQLGMKLEGGDRLSQNQRDQMLRVISEDHAAQVNIANQAVQMTRKKLQAQGITDENSLPQPYIKAKTKWEGMEEIAAMKLNAIAIHEKQKQAEAAGDKKTADDLKKQLEDIGKSAKELRQKIDKSKSAIINLDEVENTLQGWGGGAAATLIQQP